MRRFWQTLSMVLVTVTSTATVPVLMTTTAGCSSKPFCLNCSETKDAGADASIDSGMDMQQQTGLDSGGDTDDGGNGLCNLSPAQLAADPNNCGSCGNVCDFTAHHQLGACVVGDGGTPGCQPSGCEPGWVNLTGNPADGCTYECIPSDGGVDVCNGVDDDCDGKIDNNYTATYDPNGTPRYDSDPNNCGGCGFACELPGANNTCVLNTSIDRGQCQVQSCINSTAQGTYRHNPSSGDINTTGCEYHCPSPAASPGPDCNADGACTFPKETCNGIDDDCDFVVDDHLTDPSLAQPCGTACPSGNVANCVGACKAGSNICKSGVLVCTGSTGPSTETCDGVDNDCNGKIDDPFTKTYQASGKPNYDSDAKNCGACAAGCNLPNAVNMCASNGGSTVGFCHVVSCNDGFSYAAHTDTKGSPGSCNVAPPGAEDSAPGNNSSGVGCYYSCPVTKGPEVCDGVDNDCNGCADDSLTPPTNFCSKQGACAGTGAGQSPASLFCNGASGWQCDYYTTLLAKGAPVDLSVANRTGTLLATEAECDGLDNNCNGACDENFPNTAVTGASCSNAGRAAKTCTAGQGVCQVTGKYACSADTKSQLCADATRVPASPLPTAGNLALATNELCDGKDNNCNGKIDESTDDAATNTKGWHDPVVTIAAPADTSYQGLPAHTVYMYTVEASRPDSSATSPGSQTARACANTSTLPWGTVTHAQAQAACAAAAPTGRLCTTTEWQTACEGPAPVSPSWSESSTPGTYVAGVCNDANQSTTHAAWATASAGRVASPQCSTVWPTGNLSDLSGNMEEWTQTPTYTYQLSGTCTLSYPGTVGRMRLQSGSPAFALSSANIGDLVQVSGSANAARNGTFQIVAVGTTTVDVTNAGITGTFTAEAGVFYKALVANTYYGTRGGSYTSPQGGTTCEFNFDIAQPTFANNDLGFRCCFTTKP